MYMYMTVPALPFCQVPRFGKPTWKRLVEAVEDRVGGNNPALAQEIAKDHPGVYPYKMTAATLSNWDVAVNHQHLYGSSFDSYFQLFTPHVHARIRLSAVSNCLSVQ